MSNRRVKIVLLCEDTQQEVFVRRFLKQQGWENHQIRVEKSLHGEGSAEQFVRDRFPIELVSYRSISSHLSTSLVVVTDADTKEVAERIRDFDASCKTRKQPVKSRTADEKVAFLIPKRNIETWLRYLRGENFDETTPYPKLNRQRDCMPQVKSLSGMCARDKRQYSGRR